MLSSTALGFQLLTFASCECAPSCSCDLPYNASLTLNFTGLFDSPKEKEWETVEAELDVVVIHQCFDRRKNCATCITKTLASRRWLPCNPPGGQIHDETGPTAAGDEEFIKGPRSNVVSCFVVEEVILV